MLVGNWFKWIDYYIFLETIWSNGKWRAPQYRGQKMNQSSKKRDYDAVIILREIIYFPKYQVIQSVFGLWCPRVLPSNEAL